jgi:electron transfer flavoprotein-quinone oxidoreductase
MQETFDVAIVGAGPAGISAACLLAGRGVKTLVLERGAYPGAKNASGGVLYGHDLARIIPDFVERGCPIERNIVEARLWYLAKDGGYSVSYRDRCFFEDRRHNAFTVGRVPFDRWFADQAKERGAQVLCNTVVTDLLRDSQRRIVGVRTDGALGDVQANIVLLADGVNSPLAARTGFRPEVRPLHVSLAVKEVLDLPQELINERFNVGADHGVAIDIWGAQCKGMNGLAAIYTNRSSLSLCIGANLADLAKHRIPLYEMLEDFKQHPMVAPLIEGAVPREYTAHWRAEGGYDTIPQLCGDGFLIAGDSAMLFDVLHREGINMAMTSGCLAGQTILEAMGKKDFTCNGLKDYVLRLQQSYIFKDLRKYRLFGPFLQCYPEIFSSLPELAGEAAREMLTVNGVSKQSKQHLIWQNVRRQISPFSLLRLLWKGWRSVH